MLLLQIIPIAVEFRDGAGRDEHAPGELVFENVERCHEGFPERCDESVIWVQGEFEEVDIFGDGFAFYEALGCAVGDGYAEEELCHVVVDYEDLCCVICE